MAADYATYHSRPLQCAGAADTTCKMLLYQGKLEFHHVPALLHDSVIQTLADIGMLSISYRDQS